MILMKTFLTTLLLLITLDVVNVGCTQKSEEPPYGLITSCQKGSGAACSLVGNQYLEGDGVKQDRSKALEFFRQACDGQFALGCLELGATHANGKGLMQDYFKAAESYRQACDMDFGARGCLALGLAYELGEGVRQSNGDALIFYGKACDLELQEGCENYARLKTGKR